MAAAGCEGTLAGDPVQPLTCERVSASAGISLPSAACPAQGGANSRLPWVEGSKPPRGDGSGLRIITMHEAFNDVPEAVWMRHTLPKPDISFRSNNREVQAQLCAKGAGLAVLPRPLGDATPGIVPFDIGEAPPGRDTFVGYHRDLRRLSRMRALLDLVIDSLAT